jgi:glycosyltransferase involved in cell wall biosynthesis
MKEQMESGTNNKIKVAWICHFSNKEIRDMLPISKKKLLKGIKSLFGREVNHNYNDFAPWVTNLIKEFENFNAVELHIVAPFTGLKKFIFEYENKGVFYHFFKPDLPIIHAELPDKFHWGGKPQFFQNKFFVEKLINKINPDIINLIGTENPYYSSTILNIKNKPIYVSAQTVYTNPDRKILSDSCIQLNWDVELKIHQKETYYGVTGRMHRDLILNNNPHAIIFKMFFPIEKPKQVQDFTKKYDFVFFAGLDKKKGIEDLLDALIIVKKHKKNVLLNVVGSCSESYSSFLKNKIKDLDLEENIIFNGYFAMHSEMHQHLMYSKFAVLPIKLDVIPGSVIEAMLLGLPVVTYKTSGTPYLNKDGESVLIGDIGDIESLANNMIKLLDNAELGKQLKENAKNFVERTFNNTSSAKSLVSNYKAVISHYNLKTPIPEGQLFNVNEFPIY